TASEDSKKFRTCIRTYNNLFAFTSLGVKSDANLTKRNNGVYTFRVQGQVYHFINDLVPENGNAKNLQLYFHDTEHELENRLASSDRLSKHATEICMKALEKNPYACFFRSLKDVPQLENYQIILKTLPSQDQRLYNKPEVSQVAAVWVDGEENGEQSHRNIEVKIHSNQSRKIEYYYGCYDALQYPLMFPFGELGWHQGILKRGEKEYKIRGKAKPSAANLISPQNAVNVEDLLFHFGPKRWTNKIEGSSVGQRIVLPSSFIGGPRNMRRKYIDAMTLVQKYGKPDIFLAVTSNPNWPEVKERLMRQEEAQNRADLIVRVFHAKLEQLKEELLKKKIGEVAAYTYVIEFSKERPEEYDQVVSAEIPDEKENPHLHKMVVKHMLHGPCGKLNPNNFCMKKMARAKIHIQKLFLTRQLKQQMLTQSTGGAIMELP
ncbi:uncharacterized protein Tco_0843716, partial [Tanacetum coccineum]